MPKPVKGYRSSFVASILALLLLTLPLFAGNYLDKTRKGEGKFEFEEELCFDISDQEQFDNDNVFGSWPGSGALFWAYRHSNNGDTGGGRSSNVTIMDVPYNGTVNGYGVATTVPGSPEDDIVPGLGYLRFRLELTKKDILEKENNG